MVSVDVKPHVSVLRLCSFWRKIRQARKQHKTKTNEQQRQVGLRFYGVIDLHDENCIECVVSDRIALTVYFSVVVGQI